jgi:hypothetical protein
VLALERGISIVGIRAKFRLSRGLLAAAGTIIFLLAAGYFWGFQTVLCLQQRYQARKFPILNLSPQRPTSVAQSEAEGMKLSHAGFGFEVPWKDLDEQQSKKFNNIAVFRFHSGKVVTLCAPNAGHEDLLESVQKHFGSDGALQLFGAEAMKSNYALEKTMLELTPERLKPWMSQREAVGTSMLLTMKAVSSVGGETGLFRVDGSGWNGFQFDDPSRKPKRVTIELFDADDQRVEIVLVAKPFDMTQEEINRIVSTVRPLNEHALVSRAGLGAQAVATEADSRTR